MAKQDTSFREAAKIATIRTLDILQSFMLYRSVALLSTGRPFRMPALGIGQTALLDPPWSESGS